MESLGKQSSSRLFNQSGTESYGTMVLGSMILKRYAVHTRGMMVSPAILFADHDLCTLLSADGVDGVDGVLIKLLALFYQSL